jgi:hypothetical protein
MQVNLEIYEFYQKLDMIFRVVCQRIDVGVVGAIGSWENTQERGVYKTTDGGKSWKQNTFTAIQNRVLPI